MIDFNFKKQILIRLAKLERLSLVVHIVSVGSTLKSYNNTVRLRANHLIHYFDGNVGAKFRDVERNVRVGLERSNPKMHAIFLENVGYATSKGISKYLNDEDYRLAYQYVLSNYELLRECERYGFLKCLIFAMTK